MDVQIVWSCGRKCPYVMANQDKRVKQECSQTERRAKVDQARLDLEYKALKIMRTE